MFWVHVVGDILMLTLDAVWWIIALRLARKTLWRVLISLFMAAQMAAVANELLGRVGHENIDLSLYVPVAVLATLQIWHYLALPAIACAWLIYACVRFIQHRRLKKVPVTTQPAPVPAATDPVSRRQFIGACAALSPSLFTFGLAGIAVNQLNHFRLRRFDLSIPTLPKALDGLTITHISDIHVGEWTHGRILRDLVNATNNLRADLVVVTGDTINYEISDLPNALDLIKKMESRYGTWMIEGNHDLYEDGLEFERSVKASGVPLLLDEAKMANIRGCPVQFFGIRWMEGLGMHRDQVTALQVREMIKQRQPDAFPIFLAHHPHAFDAAVEAGLPLTLSGHTHGGQLMLDNQLGVGPAMFRYWSGLYQKNNCQLIVSNGVGNMFPIRVNAPAEIIHITLRCAAV
jgi:predicted MPP superfamily phosphohydrolase